MQELKGNAGDILELKEINDKLFIDIIKPGTPQANQLSVIVPAAGPCKRSPTCQKGAGHSGFCNGQQLFRAATHNGTTKATTTGNVRPAAQPKRKLRAFMVKKATPNRGVAQGRVSKAPYTTTHKPEVTCQNEAAAMLLSLGGTSNASSSSYQNSGSSIRPATATPTSLLTTQVETSPTIPMTRHDIITTNNSATEVIRPQPVYPSLLSAQLFWTNIYHLTQHAQQHNASSQVDSLQIQPYHAIQASSYP